MSFYENYVFICHKAGITPSRAAKDMGFSSGICGRWKSGCIPNQTTLLTIADYFGIDVDQLTGRAPLSFDPNNRNSPADVADSNPARDTLNLLINDMTIEELAVLIAKAAEIKNRRQNPGD